MHCHICLEPIIVETSWSTLFDFTERTLCDTCENQFQTIAPPTCKRCMKLTDEPLCQDCIYWEKKYGKDPLDQNISIYTYNEFMRETMATFKYRGDYEIVHAWKEPLRKAFQEHFPTKITIIPIPLARQRWNERGFNQAEAIAHQLGQPLSGILIRTTERKQSKRTRWERIESANPFQLIGSPPENILLIDDIFTTGTTIRQAAQTLKEQGAKQISSLTLARS